MPPRMCLQRRLQGGDAGHWRTVVRFGVAQAPAAQRAAEQLLAVDPALAWRIVDDAAPLQVLAVWDGGRWVAADVYAGAVAGVAGVISGANLITR